MQKHNLTVDYYRVGESNCNVAEVVWYDCSRDNDEALFCIDYKAMPSLTRPWKTVKFDWHRCCHTDKTSDDIDRLWILLVIYFDEFCSLGCMWGRWKSCCKIGEIPETSLVVSYRHSHLSSPMTIYGYYMCI